jgi:hypothetical protein
VNCFRKGKDDRSSSTWQDDWPDAGWQGRPMFRMTRWQEFWRMTNMPQVDNMHSAGWQVKYITHQQQDDLQYLPTYERMSYVQQDDKTTGILWADKMAFCFKMTGWLTWRLLVCLVSCFMIIRRLNIMQDSLMTHLLQDNKMADLLQNDINMTNCWSMIFGPSTSPDDDREREVMNTHLMMKMSVLR